jgi:integral membrane protein
MLPRWTSYGPGIQSARMSSWRTSLGRLRVIGFWEGISFLLLLGVAMPLKYLADSPGAVRVVGMAHGVLFVAYVLAAVHVAVERAWPWKRLGMVLLASVLPAGPFVIEAKILAAEDASVAQNG